MRARLAYGHQYACVTVLPTDALLKLTAGPLAQWCNEGRLGRDSGTSALPAP